MTTPAEAEALDRLLNDETFVQLLDEVRSDISREWMEAENADAREGLWREVKAMDRVVDRMKGKIGAFNAAARRAARKDRTPQE